MNRNHEKIANKKACGDISTSFFYRNLDLRLVQ